MTTPKELLFSKSHEWVKVDGNEATIGLSHFAQDALGDITYVELPNIGDNLKFGEEMGSIESVKAANDIYAPVSGKVIAVNEQLDATPELINSHPYTKAWLIKVKLNGKATGLLNATDYDVHCENEAH